MSGPFPVPLPGPLALFLATPAKWAGIMVITGQIRKLVYPKMAKNPDQDMSKIQITYTLECLSRFFKALNMLKEFTPR